MDKCRELRSLRWAKTTLEKKASAIPESAPSSPRTSCLSQSAGAQTHQSSAALGQPALMTIGPIKCLFQNDFCRCFMEINTSPPWQGCYSD